MRKIALALLLIVLTACGGSTPATGTDSTGGAPTAAVPSASAPAVDASAPSPSLSGDLNSDASPAAGEAAALDLKGSTMLAANVNVSPDTLKLVSKEQTEWSDSSLGCPDPGTMYMQVITPGWKLTYNDGARDYDVRSNQDGSIMVWCESGGPKTLPQP